MCCVWKLKNKILFLVEKKKKYTQVLSPEILFYKTSAIFVCCLVCQLCATNFEVCCGQVFVNFSWAEYEQKKKNGTYYSAYLEWSSSLNLNTFPQYYSIHKNSISKFIDFFFRFFSYLWHLSKCTNIDCLFMMNSLSSICTLYTRNKRLTYGGQNAIRWIIEIYTYGHVAGAQKCATKTFTKVIY